LAIKHAFVSAIADDADATLVRPSNWNDDHTIEANTITRAQMADYAARGSMTRGGVGGDVEDFAIGATGTYIRSDGTNPAFAALSIVDDTTPQLGGDLDTVAQDILLKGNLLKTTNLALKESSTDLWVVRNAADNANRDLRARVFQVDSLIEGTDSSFDINTQNADNAVLIFGARENGVGPMEVARLQSGASPTFDLVKGRLTGDFDTNASDILLKGNLLKTTDLALKQLSATEWEVRDDADAVTLDFRARTFFFNTAIQALGTGDEIRAANSDNALLKIMARDNGVGLVKVAGIQGGAIPTFDFVNDSLRIENPAETFHYSILSAAIVADHNLTLPLLTGNDTVVTEAHAATLTNKSISASQIDSGTLAHERGGLEFDASPITTGGLLRGASSGVMSILAVGADGLVLTAQADGSVAWEALPASSPHDILSASHSDSTAATVVRGDLMTGQLATPKWQRLAKGPSGDFLKAGASDLSWASLVEADISDLQSYLLNVVEDTTPQLGGQLDVNGNPLGDGTLELLKFSETVSAINEITIKNAAIGNGPEVQSTGDDVDIDLLLVAKGTGVVKADGVQVVTLTGTETLTNKSIDEVNNTITNIADASIAAHTSTKITITAKGQLNSALVYNDQTNVFGDFDQDFKDNRLRIENPAATFFYTITAAAIAANRVLTLPLITGADTLVSESLAQTLALKTLTTPTIASFVNATHDHLAAAGGGTLAFTKTISIPIAILNAQFDANQGNTFPDVLDIGTPNNVHVWTSLQDVDGKTYARVHIPNNLASSPAVKIILRIMANATTGVTRISVTHTDVNNGENFNVAVTESITAIDTTVPGTAFEAEDITFTLSTQPSADDTMDIEIFHEGAHANDTLAVPTLLVSARLEVVVDTVG